eukprot:3384086-Amphidinium_carterae.1
MNLSAFPEEPRTKDADFQDQLWQCLRATCEARQTMAVPEVGESQTLMNIQNQQALMQTDPLCMTPRNSCMGLPPTPAMRRCRWWDARTPLKKQDCLTLKRITSSSDKYDYVITGKGVSCSSWESLMPAPCPSKFNLTPGHTNLYGTA